MNDLDKTELQTALDTGRALGEIKRVAYDGATVPFCIKPCEYDAATPDLATAEHWLDRPVRKRGNYAFVTVESFIRYFNEHKTEASRIFASVSGMGASFRGVLDFHDDKPAHGEHLCHATLHATPEWQSWMGHAKQPMNQGDFAQFLEDNAALFIAPTGADLLEIISSLEGFNNATIKQALKTTNGQVKISYDEEIQLKGVNRTQGGELELPTNLQVSIAPFEGVTHYTMSARLRWRIQQSRISFWYEPVDAHVVMRVICADLMANIETKTKVTPFRV